MQAGTVAFLFSDVEGSTGLLRDLGEDYPLLLEEHHRLLRGAFDRHGGRVVDTQGDSFFVVFPRVRDATAAAVALQRAVAAHSWPGGAAVRVRIGIHAGEPLVNDERVVGIGVHRAARICAVAHGGQVLLSEAAASLLADTQLGEMSVRGLGSYTLKDFDRPERLSELAIDGLDLEFPPLAAERAAPVPLEFRLLGPLEVLRQGTPVQLGGQRQRALLAVLVLEAGRVVSTDRLVELIYGSEPPKTATTSLQNSISALRKLLGQEIVETRAPGYLLRAAPDATDAGRFERLLGLARSAAPEERAQLLSDALELWRGSALADFAYEEFAQSEARRLEGLRLVALEQRLEAEIDLGRQADAVGELEVLVAQHPLRERFWRLLMAALYATGRQAEALEAYQRARAALDEIGIEPSAELQDLHLRMLRHEVSAPSEGSAERACDSEIVRGFLTGRVVLVLGLAGAADLAERLASAFDYPRDRPLDLARVSQYVATMRGSGPLYDELHERFEAAVEPGPLHHFAASLPGLARDHGAAHPLVVTTNYDLALERAFADAGEEIDVVAYVATGRHRGRFWHQPPGGPPQQVDLPNTYATELSLERRPVLLKLRGAVDTQPDRVWESFVITEDDYIDYLGRADLANAVPVGLAAKLRRSHFLFIGFEMADWNLRLILGRIWGERAVAYGSWAVQPKPTPLELAFWRRWEVDVIDADPEAYVDLLVQLMKRTGR